MSLLLLFHPQAEGGPTPPTPTPEPTLAQELLGGGVKSPWMRSRKRMDEDDEDIIAAVIAFITQQRH